MVHKTISTISDFGMSSRITYECISILNVDIFYLRKNKIDLIYSSAAFSTDFSLYLLFLSVYADCFLCCSKNVIENIYTAESRLKLPVEEELNFPTGKKNDVWQLVTHGTLYNSEIVSDEETNGEDEERNIFMVNPEKLVGARLQSNILKTIRKYASYNFDLDMRNMRYGSWATKVIEKYERMKTSGAYINLDINMSNAACSIYAKTKYLKMPAEIIKNCTNNNIFMQTVLQNYKHACIKINELYVIYLDNTYVILPCLSQDYFYTTYVDNTIVIVPDPPQDFYTLNWALMKIINSYM